MTTTIKPPRKTSIKPVITEDTKTIITESLLNKQLQEHFGFDAFKHPQEEIIKSVLKGKDTFVIMPTGGGKSLCYQLPAIISKGCAIIVSPLIALMKN
jgi:ATP-dependent DNA helicase RecQ